MMRLATVFFLAMTISVQAQGSATGRNLPPDFYPPSPCVKPGKVLKDGTARTSSSSAQYWAPMTNSAVERYNQDAPAFTACVKSYADNARLDILQILAAVNAAATGIAPAPTGGGNMLPGFYPAPACTKPDQAAVGAPPDGRDALAMAAYNLRVQTFNASAIAFSDCFKAYRSNAQADIAQIQAVMQAVVADANTPLAAPDKGDFMTQRRR
jgi:hypothetical protein